jgi:hypothetical protein
VISAVLLARVVLAAVFGVAAVAKLADREGSRRTLRAFGVPERLALAVPLAELATTAGLLTTAFCGALAALALLAVFSAAIVAALVRGVRPDCGCFARVHSAPAGRAALVRNIALVACAALVIADPATQVTDWLVAVGVVAAAHAAFSWQLLRQNGRLWQRIEALERRA